jgi:hypothetical protein
MLDLDDQQAREVGARPLPVEVVGLLLLDPVVAIDAEALAVRALETRIGRFGTEPAEVRGKVAVEDGDRVARLRKMAIG